jgi:anti-sigma factor RsiW
MSSTQCRSWREQIGAFVLGHLDLDEQAALKAHLDGCAECQAEAEELAAVAGLLPEADPARLGEQPAIPAGLGRQVFARIGEERRAARRRRRRFSIGAVGVAAVAATAAVLLISSPIGVDPDSQGYALTSFQRGAEGAVSFERRAWGSQITLTTSGLPAAMYRVWVERPDGTRIPAGSFRGVPGRTLRVELASSLAREQAAAVGVSGSAGRTMLYAKT